VNEEGKEVKVVNLRLDDIIPNRFQPREVFDEKALQELSDSIKEHGVIEPIIVRRLGDKYELIAGERRTKASALAGNTTIPAIIKDIDDKESAKMSLLENLQRKNLSAIEEAKTYKRIIELENMTQEQLARTIGKSQPMVANKMRLLGLPNEVQDALLNNEISERHARSMLTLPDKASQLEFLNRVKNEKLTVRELDKLIKEYKKNYKKKVENKSDLEGKDEGSNMNNRSNYGSMGLNDYQSGVNNNMFNNMPNNYNDMGNPQNFNSNQGNQNMSSLGSMLDNSAPTSNSTGENNLFVSHIREDNLPKVDNQFLPNFDNMNSGIENGYNDMNSGMNNNYNDMSQGMMNGYNDMNSGMNNNYNDMSQGMMNGYNDMNSGMNNYNDMNQGMMNGYNDMNSGMNNYNDMNQGMMNGYNDMNSGMNNNYNMNPGMMNGYNDMNSGMNNNYNMNPGMMNGYNDMNSGMNNNYNMNPGMMNGYNDMNQGMNNNYNMNSGMNNYNGMNVGMINNGYNGNQNNYQPIPDFNSQIPNYNMSNIPNQGQLFERPLNIVDVKQNNIPNPEENTSFEVPGGNELFDQTINLDENIPEEPKVEDKIEDPIHEEENSDIEVIGENETDSPKNEYVSLDPVTTIHSTMEAVYELKKTTDKIKENKIPIETEEIDYGDVYQITIKLKKTDE